MAPKSFDPGDPALPVAGTGSLSHVATSRRAKWRAAVLIGVHVVILAHATHFLLAGTTLSPVEPSESMYALELGQLNAGFVFFLLALLSTVIFGRYFCGWGCHLVALQDLCGWMMKKVGIRPRPFRSRWLPLLPLGVALYMFVWPTVKRWIDPSVPRFPGFENHLMTDGFWDTFPGPFFTAITFLICGFAAVYFLGAKGFCTYGCPYGAFFAPLDKLSPGRIRVTDDCEQCGHCTATCTSNVRVHQEVRDHGMVVDPGCMKCMDCVSVCPKDALYFGFGRPAIFLPKSRTESGTKAAGRKSKKTKSLRPPLPTATEAFLLAGSVAGLLVFRGLYDGPPLLLSAGLGAITAWLALKLWRLARRNEARVQNLVLKRGGHWTAAGATFAALGTLWLVFAVHSGFVQYHRARGAAWMERTEATRADVLSGRFRTASYGEDHRRALSEMERHYAIVDRWGMFPTTEVQLGLAWSHLLADETDAAVARLQSVVERAPHAAQQHENLIEVLATRGRDEATIEALQNKIRNVEPSAEDWLRLGGLLAQRERNAEAAEAYAAGLELEPENTIARYNLGGLLRRTGDPAGAIEQLERVRAERPDDADTRVELGLAYRETGRTREAIDSFRAAIELAPQSPESLYYLPDLIRQLEAEEREAWD